MARRTCPPGSSRLVWEGSAMLAAAVVATLIAGCSDSDDAGAGSSSIAGKPSTTTTPPADGVEAQVLAVYRNMQAAAVRAFADPAADHPEVQRYATDEALAGIESSIVFYRQNGTVLRGGPVLHPRVTSLRPEMDPTTAAIEDCLDSTNWTPVRLATGETVTAPGQRLQYPVHSVARLLDGKWLIAESIPDRAAAC